MHHTGSDILVRDYVMSRKTLSENEEGVERQGRGVPELSVRS